MQKIIFGITSLTLGGAERVLVDGVNELSNRFDITIFTLYGQGELENELSDNIKIINMINKPYKKLKQREKLAVSLKLLLNKKAIYKKYINKGYNTEIAFLEGPITRLFSAKNKKVRKIAWVHNDISQVFGKGIKASIKKKMDKKCYSQYDKIVFVSNDNKEQFENTYKIDNDKVVIYNYISSKRILEKANLRYGNIFKEGKINFLTVARLTKQKAIDRLIKVHSKLIDDGVEHNFFIIGDGPEKENLLELIKVYNVQDSFKLLGQKENPYPYIKNCDIYALLSHFEGYGMTVVEAEILDKPILLTDTAAREAVEKYKKSYITENTEQGIYDGIKNSIKLLKQWENQKEQQYFEQYEIINQIEKLVKNK